MRFLCTDSEQKDGSYGGGRVFTAADAHEAAVKFGRTKSIENLSEDGKVVHVYEMDDGTKFKLKMGGVQAEIVEAEKENVKPLREAQPFA